MRETYGRVSYGYVSVTALVPDLGRCGAICPCGVPRPASEDPMTTTTDATAARASDELIPRTAARQEIMPERSSALDRSLVAVFVTIPFLALIAAVPLA